MIASLLKYGGLVLPPAVWAAATQLGQILPYTDCHDRLHLTATVTVVAALLALAGAMMPRAVLVRMQRRTDLFIRDLGCLVGLVFAFAILLQGAASVLLNACQR